MTTNRKPPQSDFSQFRVDTTDAERLFVLLNVLTQEIGNDLRTTPEFVELDNKRRDENGDPWRWVEWSEAA